MRIQCLILILARGTGEPLFPEFGTIVGDPLFAATTLRFGGTASISGYAVNVCRNPTLEVTSTVITRC
jgi:hypothetical protein